MKIKNIVCIDTETTGLNANEDHIIQLSLVKIELQTGIELNVFDRYIIPERKFEISRSAEEVHGITKDFLLENGVYLKDVANEILEILNDSDAYLTYNGNTFDFKFLIKDFAEIGYEFPLNKPCIDSYAMECRMNPRDLMSVYKKYTDEEFENAHNSLSDVRATIKVFDKQCDFLKSSGVSFDELLDWKENKLLDPSGFIRDASTKGEDMKLVFACGKYRDSEVYDVMMKDPNYISWWAKEVASSHIKNIVRDYLKNIKNKTEQKSAN